MPRTPKRPAPLKVAAPYAGLCVNTLRARIKDGTLSAWRNGPKIIIVDLDEVDRKLRRPIAAAGGGADAPAA